MSNPEVHPAACPSARFRRLWSGIDFFTVVPAGGVVPGDTLSPLTPPREGDTVEFSERDDAGAATGRVVHARVQGVYGPADYPGLADGHAVLSLMPYGRTAVEVPTFRVAVAPPRLSFGADLPAESPAVPADAFPADDRVDLTPDESYECLRVDYGRLKAEFAALEVDKLRWEQRALHADEAVREAEDRVRIALGRTTDDPDLMGPYNPAREYEPLTVPYGAWYQQQRLKASAERDRDKVKTVLADVMRLINPYEPVYNVGVVFGSVAELLATRDELRQALESRSAEVRFLHSRLRAFEMAAADGPAALAGPVDSGGGI